MFCMIDPLVEEVNKQPSNDEESESNDSTKTRKESKKLEFRNRGSYLDSNDSMIDPGETNNSSSFLSSPVAVIVFFCALMFVITANWVNYIELLAF